MIVVIDYVDDIDVLVLGDGMYVITFANSKGGSGKTTSALLLTEQIARSGGRVALLDLDPNANVVGWAGTRRENGRGLPFQVHARPPVEDIVALIDAQEGEVDYLVVDLEGSRDQVATYALSRTDLCVIPLDGSAMEARQAAQAVKLVQSTSKMIRRPIAHVLLFARTNAAFMTSDERDVRQVLEAGGSPVLAVSLARRAPYTRIFRDALLLGELPAIVEAELRGKTASVTSKALAQVTSAIGNAEAYAQAVINELARSVR